MVYISNRENSALKTNNQKSYTKEASIYNHCPTIFITTPLLRLELVSRQKSKPVGANSNISRGYAMLEQPEGLSQTCLQISGSAHPTVSVKKSYLLLQYH
jgi:hypothetical protein